MDKIKKTIIILVFLILVTIVILASIININKKEESSGNIDKGGPAVTEGNFVESVDDINMFFTIKGYVEEYYTNIESLWYDNSMTQVWAGDEPPTGQYEIDSYYAEKLYNILGKKYIETKSITLENIGDTFEQSRKVKTFVNEILSYDISDQVVAYFVKGYNYVYETSSKEDIDLIVVVDEENICYGIYPTEYITNLKLNEVTIEKNVNIKADDFTVTRNQGNIYKKGTTSLEKRLQEYASLYKFNLTYDIQTAYETLNEEYRNSKFGSVEEYKTYINSNSKSIELSKYATEEAESFTQYACMTTTNSYFIINEYGPMDYSIMLDPYTVNLETFIKKYNTSADTTKIAYNIEKVKQAINDKDYKYVYNKLNETFKASNYPTLELFEIYIKENFFASNAFSCDDIKEQNGTYIFTIKVTSTNEEITEEKSVNIIMKLLDNANFQMSFGTN